MSDPKRRPNSTRNIILTFPDRLRELREVRGLSRTQLGAAAGTSERAVVALELRQRAPSLELAGRLAQALGESVDSLFYPAGAPPIPARKNFPKIEKKSPSSVD